LYKSITALLLLGVIWSLFIVAGTLQGWFRSPIAPQGDTDAFMLALTEHLDTESYGNLALVLIDGGEISNEHYTSIGDPVSGNTQFQVASLSKWFTASGIMKLVEEGEVDLDAPVSQYISRWHLPAATFNNNEVTVRRLLSHTAGLTDGLGFAGYPPNEALPTLEIALDKPSDFGRGAEVKVGVEPGSEWRYSGGGYLILQLLIEEVSGQAFEDFMQAEILRPLGMTRSTFVYPENPVNMASSYTTSGEPAPLNRFAASGAAGLYTTAIDITRFLQAQVGNSRHPLLEETIQSMRTPHATTLGQDIWGLGVMLLVPTSNNDFIFGHAGSNAPAINTLALVNPETSDGLVIFESGHRTLATDIGSMWNFWQTGLPDIIRLESELEQTILIILAGWVVIVLFIFFKILRTRRQEEAG